MATIMESSFKKSCVLFDALELIVVHNGTPEFNSYALNGVIQSQFDLFCS